jgi:branched-chain amino acid transport system ATP-binding protein
VKAQATTDHALEVKDLYGGYGRTTVIRNIQLTVPAGSIVAVLGPNGAGKSTLLRTVAGLLRPQKGQLLLHGEDVTSLAPHDRTRRGLTLIPEGRGIFPSLSVRDNIRLQSSRRREKDGLERALTAFPMLESHLDRRAGMLSGGQQQILAVAQAYVRTAKLTLVDEPSLGLAPQIIETILTFLERVREEGSSVVIADQFAARVLAMADTAVVLRRGEIVFAGSARELLSTDLFATYVGEPPSEV